MKRGEPKGSPLLAEGAEGYIGFGVEVSESFPRGRLTNLTDKPKFIL